MGLPELDEFHKIILGMIVGAMLLFSPTRAILAWVFKTAFEGLKFLVARLFTFAHESSKRVLEAHLCWLKNWGPRQMVVPSVTAKRPTQRP